MELPSNYLSKFTVHQSDMLFDLEPKDIHNALAEKRCPKCGNKLHIPLKGKMAFCKSKKHKQTFKCSIDKLKF